jgi:hypothetical protein
MLYCLKEIYQIVISLGPINGLMEKLGPPNIHQNVAIKDNYKYYSSFRLYEVLYSVKGICLK